MKKKFCEEFEVDSEGVTYYVNAEGERTWEDERVFTKLSKFVITDEFGTRLDDSEDLYNEIKEDILYPENEETEDDTEEWDEKEIPQSSALKVSDIL
jgi:hypothetical protein